jgi:iron(III) transport system substrate-binding protein
MAGYQPHRIAVGEGVPDGFYDKKAGWVALRATGIAIMYNTNTVKAPNVPKTWKELIDPKWKGRIAISDPNRAGSSFSHLYAMWKMYGPDYVKALAANDVMVAGDGSATRQAVAMGERDIAPVSEYDAFEFKKQGKPVDVAWPQDGTILLPAPIALVKGCPNLDNAKALAVYMLSKEGQELISDATLTWSPRRDVAAPDGKPPLDSIKTTSFDWSEVAAQKSTVLNLYFKDFQSN